MRIVGVCIISLLIALTAFMVAADIELTGIKDEYIFGESVNLDASIDYKKEVYGYFKLTLSCTRQKSDYFLIPLLVKEGKTATVSPEPIKLSKKKSKLNDECYILAAFLNEDKDEIIAEKSDVFEVTADFEVDVEIENTKLHPGDELLAKINLDIPEEAFTEIEIDLTINKKLSRYNSEEKDFTISYTIPDNIKSGKHDALFQVEDSYGNYAEKEITIEIVSSPDYIKNLYLKESYNAEIEEETVMIKPALYDETDSLIDDQALSIKITNPSGKVIASDNVISTVSYKFKLNKDMEPGEYTLTTSFNDIEERSYFTILNAGFKKPEPTPEKAVTEDEEEAGSGETGLSSITGKAVKTNDSGGAFNLWKIITIVLIAGIVVYAAFAYGKSVASGNRNRGKAKEIFKRDEFTKEKEHKKRTHK